MTGEYIPYTTRACAACRQHKLRCQMNEGPPWACQRCQQKKLDCVIPERRPRQRKKRGNNLRLEQLERNVERVMSLLPHTTSFAEPEASEETNPFNSSPQDSLSDVISQNILSIEHAVRYLTDYRSQFARNFPYVVLPESSTLEALRRTNPVLLLAIFVTACWEDRLQQDALNQAFLQMLSTKLLIQGDRDLDLLQGLLVYLNWIHLHMSSNTQQAYRFMSIAVSLVVDYGITRRPSKGRHQQLNLDTTNKAVNGITAIDAEFWDVEARRAYLGCYHIATWYSIMTRNLSPLAYNEYLLVCARSLATAKKAPWDGDLIFHLEITREVEKVYTLFNYTETHQPQHMTDEQMRIYLEAFSAKLQDWRSRLPLSFRDDPCQQIWPWIFETFIREVGLSGLHRSQEVSVFRISVIVDSLSNIKRYLDIFLLIPSSCKTSLPTTHWALLVYSIMLAATLSLSIQIPGWSIGAARSIIKLDEYLDTISTQVRPLSLAMTHSEALKDWYGGLVKGWDKIRTCYLAEHQHHQGDAENQTLTPADSQSATQQGIEQQIDTSYRPPGGFGIFDQPADASLWMFPDIDFMWHEIAGFTNALT